MYLIRVPLFCLALITALAACHRDEKTVVTAAGVEGPLTAMNLNRQVLGPDGRCAILVDVDYSWYSAQAPSFEDPLQRAIQQLDEARLNKDSAETIQSLAHRVRKSYARLITKWYKPFLTFTGGPFRCLVRGRQVEELSSDDLFKNVPGYRSYVQSIEGIPETVSQPGALSRVWTNIKSLGTR